MATDADSLEKGESKEKDPKEIQKEIAAIIRQITASVSFLPMLDNPCTFDLLVYTHTSTSTPQEVSLQTRHYPPTSRVWASILVDSRIIFPAHLKFSDLSPAISIRIQWEESDPKYITQSNEVRLRSFTTKVHTVETSVAYRVED